MSNLKELIKKIDRKIKPRSQTPNFSQQKVDAKHALFLKLRQNKKTLKLVRKNLNTIIHNILADDKISLNIVLDLVKQKRLGSTL